MDLLQRTDKGLYCEPGDFYIDPCGPVQRAIVTHAHSDHARVGSQRYLASEDSINLLRMRLGSNATIIKLRYGESLTIGGVEISFHPAGHILGSAQVRLAYRGFVAVVTGDYKLGTDKTCKPWEPVRCHLLVTESTFALPIYRWNDQSEEFSNINRWWSQCAAAGQCCILYGYAVGKSQRLLSGLDPSIGPICTHDAVEKANEAYRKTGITLPTTMQVSRMPADHDWSGTMVVAVPSAHATSWMQRFGDVSTAFASGWMQIRGNRRRRSVDRGFPLSDHVDWPEFLQAVELTNPQEIWVTHGYNHVAARYLRDQGWQAVAIDTRVARGNENLDSVDQEASR